MANKSSGKPDADQDPSERQDEPEHAQKDETANATAGGGPSEDEQDSESKRQTAPADDGDDDADEDDGDSEPAAKAVTVDSARSKRKESPSRRRKGPPTPAEPPSEDEIDSPSKQTLGMLGVVAAATLVMWGVGRAKCNYHEVGEGMKPREVTLEERTRAPKEVAFEFQHALASYDLDTAAKLATGSAKKLVDDRKKACPGGNCAKKQESLAGKVNSISELLKRTPTHAVARTWSVGSDVGSDKHALVLKRVGKDWKVESYEKGTGENVELPGMTSGYGQGASSPEQGLPELPPSHPPVGTLPHRPSDRQPSPAQPSAPTAPKPPAKPPVPVHPAPLAPKAPVTTPKADKPATGAPTTPTPTSAQ